MRDLQTQQTVLVIGAAIVVAGQRHQRFKVGPWPGENSEHRVEITAVGAHGADGGGSHSGCGTRTAVDHFGFPGNGIEALRAGEIVGTT